MRILVTGGAGFIGSHVAQGFLDAGHEVLVIDDLSTGRRENVPPQAQLLDLDLAGEGLAPAVAEFRPEIINHHAARADIRQSVADPISEARVNVLGTVALLHAAVHCGTRKFVLASSGGAIYGEPEKLPCSEEHPLRPISPYGAAKLAGEIYVQTFGRLYGLDYTILRYANVYGPRQHPYTEEGQVVALFARQMLSGREPTIFGGGEQARDFVYVGDVVEANIRALARGSEGLFNIGTGRLVTVKQLFERLRSLAGYQGEVRYAPKRSGEVFRISLDASWAGQGLGWEPDIPLEQGLQRTVDWMREQLNTGLAR